MKKGDNIKGYVISHEVKVSGLSTWSFASRDGKNYFIKEFLSPVFPASDAPGSEATKEKKRKDCIEFENLQNNLKNKVATAVSDGGNLIFTKDFFRFGTKYYKVTDKVDVAAIELGHISKLNLDKIILILKTATKSIETLHNLKIVHGDLKPDNILIKVTETGNYTAKLIDFDNSYFSSCPPNDRTSVVGTVEYYSPELERYIKEDEAVKPSYLTLKSDIFALGVIFCQYLTNEFPVNIPDKTTASNAVINAKIIGIKELKHFPLKLINLVNSMLLLDYNKRPTISEVFNALKTIDKVDRMEEPLQHQTTGKLKTNIRLKEEDVVDPTKPKLKVNIKTN